MRGYGKNETDDDCRTGDRLVICLGVIPCIYSRVDFGNDTSYVLLKFYKFNGFQ